MNLEIDHVPECVSQLTDILQAEGFGIASSFGSGRENWVIDLRQGACLVRLTVDRGQWWVGIGGSMDALYDPDIWVACLDGVPVAREPTSLEERARFVRSRWREVAAAAVSETVGSCLERTGLLRTRERLGLPPIVGDEI